MEIQYNEKCYYVFIKSIATFDKLFYGSVYLSDSLSKIITF